MAQSDDALMMWTVYDHPRDYPHSFVARKFAVSGAGGTVATTDMIVAPTLDSIRKLMIERGLTCITRSPDDDPKIVETWL
jgi:hypothetical protein